MSNMASRVIEFFILGNRFFDESIFNMFSND